ncbi:cytochrome c biogenesis CcdA family protein [Thermoflexus sp.]|uniref:cytochrome c biogenesis CcdA family protein n=1 Tax=Thermoflexus sp. TaxID=1969742 RepID=UPI0035E40B30
MNTQQGSARLRYVILASLLLTVLIGLAVLLNLVRPRIVASEHGMPFPALTLSTVILSGFVDGMNPCAFTVLLLFVAAMLTTLQTTDPSDLQALRGRILSMGSIYIAAIFLTYLGLGVGLLAAAAPFSQYHLPSRIGALIAIGMGLWMIKDVLIPELGPPLAAPRAIVARAVEMTRRLTVPALALGGFLIGLCTVPCSGAIYLAILSLLAAQPSRWQGFAYLVLYNLMFIVPLVLLLLAAAARPTLRQLARWNRTHGPWLKFTLGLIGVGMGLLILATV